MQELRLVIESSRNSMSLPVKGLPPAAAGLSLAEWAALIMIVLAEIWLFSGSFRKFFTHDSLFYLINAPQSWQQFWSFLTAPTPEKNYRPLNLGLVALIKPWLGVDPQPYHVIPVAFHLANTLLFFALARKLLSGTAALAAAVFWGLHSVAGWVTYDLTYLSDFLLAFLFLLSLLLCLEGSRRRSRLLIAASLFVFGLSLLTKESAVTFPLAVWIVLALAGLRESEDPLSGRRIFAAFKRTLPLAGLYLILAAAFAGLFVYWYLTGDLYTLSTQAAYSIDPWANPLAKLKYIFWAVNLPDTLSIRHPEENRALALGLMACLLVFWGRDVVRRRGRLSVAEWAGLVWFAGLNIPSLLLSGRLGKWYLYLPLFGLALTFGGFAESLRARACARFRWFPGAAVPALLAIPLLFATLVQTRSYVISSDSAYQSEILQACLTDFRRLHPTLPPEVTVFFLPAFDEGISALLSAPPLDRGQLFELYYPGTRVRALFAHRHDHLPKGFQDNRDVIVLQYLDQVLYDVTDHFRSTGKMTLHLLPTFEHEVAPLLRKVPAGGWDLHREFVQLSLADDRAGLPADYGSRSDLWILQYLNGVFTDVTSYYKGRRLDSARRVIRSLDGVYSEVSRSEIYPDYNRFDTPTGAPVFFLTAENEILTQIGGSTIVIPLGKIPPAARLQCDISWMYSLGDGGWAEIAVRANGKESVEFRDYLSTDNRRRSLLWKEVSINLQRYADAKADLVLKCYNDPGKNTVADWLNWRDITIGSAASAAK